MTLELNLPKLFNVLKNVLWTDILRYGRTTNYTQNNLHCNIGNNIISLVMFAFPYQLYKQT